MQGAPRLASPPLASTIPALLYTRSAIRAWYLDSMPIQNPFQDPLRFERRVPECVVAIFGANGDLTKRKLMPALYRLAYDRRLSAGFAVVGISRTPMGDDQFREKMLESVKQFSEDTKFDSDVWDAFAAGLFYVAGDISDKGLYERLAKRLAEIEEARHTGGNVMFYLSMQPSQYASTALGLGAAGPGKGKGWRRLVVEKPFGHDLESARELSDSSARGVRRNRCLPHRSLPG